MEQAEYTLSVKESFKGQAIKTSSAPNRCVQTVVALWVWPKLLHLFPTPAMTGTSGRDGGFFDGECLFGCFVLTFTKAWVHFMQELEIPLRKTLLCVAVRPHRDCLYVWHRARSGITEEASICHITSISEATALSPKPQGKKPKNRVNKCESI